MLKYFKRQKSRRRSSQPNENDDDDGKCQDVNAAAAALSDSSKRNSLRSTSSFCDELLSLHEDATDEVDYCGGSLCDGSIGTAAALSADEDIFKYHSRLSMSLHAIVNEPNCLSYFVQYLEAKSALALIKFYLDTENFKTAAITQLEREQLAAQLKPAKKFAEQQPQHAEDGTEATSMQEANGPRSKAPTVASAEAPEEDGEGENNVPEMKTLYDMSMMRKPLTDDEKSQIYAETNKQMSKSCNKLTASSELSLCSISTSATEPDCGTEPVYAGTISKASVKDAIAIYQKYLIANAKQFVTLPVAILSQISLLLCKRTDDDDVPTLPIAPTCFDEAQQHVLLQLESEYLNDFLQSPFYCKYCIELIEGHLGEEKLSIYDILYSEVTLFFFMEFLEQHGERDCLDFWTTAINFRKSFAAEQRATADEAEAQADAMIIYEKFFSLQSEYRLWMSHRLRCRVEERICAAGHVAYCFDLPLQITARYLEQKYFAEFLKSQLFANYLNELKTKIHEELAIGTLPQVHPDDCTNSHHKLSLRRKQHNKSATAATGHRKTLSDCTNESTRELFKHISQQNTLLAMDTTHLKHLHNNGTNLNIDSRQLTNPNLLWHRSNSTNSGLKFGRVNSLGRYERDFEAVEAANNAAGGKHNWSLSLGGNKIKNAMRKLINLPEDKVQEEIAWQVAEMIVKDVTSITLASEENAAK